MSNLSELSFGDLAALICSTLRANGVRTTLSGGACAQIYSAGVHVTGDLDFVVNYLVPGKQEREIEAAMSQLGFRRSGRLYVNDTIEYTVEFPPGPLGIGDQWQVCPVEMHLRTGVLSLLSPTDCVKDRLASFFYANDRQCLRQALLVCRRNEVDLEEIRRWGAAERQDDKMGEFNRELAGGADGESPLNRPTMLHTKGGQTQGATLTHVPGQRSRSSPNPPALKA